MRIVSWRRENTVENIAFENRPLKLPAQQVRLEMTNSSAQVTDVLASRSRRPSSRWQQAIDAESDAMQRSGRLVMSLEVCSISVAAW